MAYAQFDKTKPVDSDDGPVVITSANANDRALRDGIIIGRIAGWTLTVTNGTGTAEEPQIRTWANGTERLRATHTYTAGYVTAVTWEWSTDSGSTWFTVASETATYDASGNQTGGANSSLLSWLWEWAGKVKRNYAYVVAHVAGVGAAVHGLASMAIQAANAVAITGGYAELTYEREAKIDKGSISGSTAITWTDAGLFTMTVTGSGAVLTHSALPSGKVGYVTIDVTNGGLATSLFAGCHAPGGAKPVLKTSGRDVVVLMCHDGATPTVVGIAADEKVIT